MGMTGMDPASASMSSKYTRLSTVPAADEENTNIQSGHAHA